jgi:hypothetical protein
MFALVNMKIHGTYHAMWRQQHGDDDALAQDARHLRVQNEVKRWSMTSAK